MLGGGLRDAGGGRWWGMRVTIPADVYAGLVVEGVDIGRLVEDFWRGSGDSGR